MKCYSAIKRNKNKSFVDEWMGPECDTRSKVRKRKQMYVYVDSRKVADKSVCRTGMETET